MPFGGWACSYQTNIPNYSKMAIKVIYIDLFCGAGGTSTGVHLARHAGDPCAKVIACVNHDANAIASHAANHPDALHYTEDIRTLELGPLTAHAARMRRQYPDAFVVLWASLECTNFSRAKGGLPRDADSRTLAEHLFRYIEALNPDYIQIENVEEFMSWGDLDERGKPVSRATVPEMDRQRAGLRVRLRPPHPERRRLRGVHFPPAVLRDLRPPRPSDRLSETDSHQEPGTGRPVRSAASQVAASAGSPRP